MWCAIKLAPSVPAAKVKQVMFVYLLEVLNNDGPVLSFFTPHHIHVPHKQRTCKPREGGDQPIGAMAIDAPSPVAPSQPNPPSPLHPGLVPGDRGPSLEEPAGDGFNVASGQASYSPGVSPSPSDCTVVPMSPLRLEPPHSPSVLGVKQSPLSTSPFSPSPSPIFPSSPPPRQGTQAGQLLQDWQDWITERCQLAGRTWLTRVSMDDLVDYKGLLLAQVENMAPPPSPTLGLCPHHSCGVWAPTAFPPYSPQHSEHSQDTHL